MQVNTRICYILKCSTDIVLSAEDADDNGGELGRRAARRHERGARHVRRQLQLWKETAS